MFPAAEPSYGIRTSRFSPVRTGPPAMNIGYSLVLIDSTLLPLLEDYRHAVVIATQVRGNSMIHQIRAAQICLALLKASGDQVEMVDGSGIKPAKPDCRRRHIKFLRM